VSPRPQDPSLRISQVKMQRLVSRVLARLRLELDEAMRQHLWPTTFSIGLVSFSPPLGPRGRHDPDRGRSHVCRQKQRKEAGCAALHRGIAVRTDSGQSVTDDHCTLPQIQLVEQPLKLRPSSSTKHSRPCPITEPWYFAQSRSAFHNYKLLEPKKERPLLISAGLC
jgi:hypothetical protein